MICRWCSPAFRDVGKYGRLLSQTARLMVGVPDYRTYVEHRKETHPGEPVMTEEEYFRDRQNRRYGGGPGSAMRCC